MSDKPARGHTVEASNGQGDFVGLVVLKDDVTILGTTLYVVDFDCERKQIPLGSGENIRIVKDVYHVPWCACKI